MKENLVISEKFYSIQGEGQTMGVPSIFVRLAGCNILCQSSSWVCDSIEVWQKGVSTPFKDVLSDELVTRLEQGVHLIFTGGEPLLHQKKIVAYLDWFWINYQFTPIVEVETNGTIEPCNELIRMVNFWNCSPKLSNSGVLHKERINEVALRKINEQGKNKIFKFVISEKTDFLDVLTDFGDHIDMKNAVLMPAGESQDKLQETRPLVAELCIEQGLRYSERLHIVIWNKKTGV